MQDIWGDDSSNDRNRVFQTYKAMQSEVLHDNALYMRRYQSMSEYIAKHSAKQSPLLERVAQSGHWPNMMVRNTAD